jgi:hypothetical protein
MRSSAQIRAVFELKSRGLSDGEVTTLTGVPVDTIRLWRKRQSSARVQRALHPNEWCGNCGATQHDFRSLGAPAYAYLLGVYLGDGCLTRWRGSWTLRVALDDGYPGIIADCCASIEQLRGERPTFRPDARAMRCVYVESAWRSWPCFFPQHGPGRKHHRKIELLKWQQAIVDAQPGAFLRALIHTDGWRGSNRVHVKGNDYSYPRYQFSNRSDDIRKLFTDTCETLGVEWRQWTRHHISIARRDSVAILDSFIGPKR